MTRDEWQRCGHCERLELRGASVKTCSIHTAAGEWTCLDCGDINYGYHGDDCLNCGMQRGCKSITTGAAGRTSEACDCGWPTLVHTKRDHIKGVAPEPGPVNSTDEDADWCIKRAKHYDLLAERTPTIKESLAYRADAARLRLLAARLREQEAEIVALNKIIYDHGRDMKVREP